MKSNLLTAIVFIWLFSDLAASKAKSLHQIRSLKNQNQRRIKSSRRLTGGYDLDFTQNPLIYAPEETEHQAHSDNLMSLHLEITKQHAKVKELKASTESIQRKSDIVSERIMDRVNEIYNLVQNQLLGMNRI